jgi:hypothetical protein
MRKVIKLDKYSGQSIAHSSFPIIIGRRLLRQEHEIGASAIKKDYE